MTEKERLDILAYVKEQEEKRKAEAEELERKKKEDELMQKKLAEDKIERHRTMLLLEQERLRRKKIREIIKKQKPPQRKKPGYNVPEEDFEMLSRIEDSFTDEELAAAFVALDEKGENIYREPFDWLDLSKDQFTFAQEIRHNAESTVIMKYLHQLKYDKSIPEDEKWKILDHLYICCEWTPGRPLKIPDPGKLPEKRKV